MWPPSNGCIVGEAAMPIPVLESCSLQLTGCSSRMKLALVVSLCPPFRWAAGQVRALQPPCEARSLCSVCERNSVHGQSKGITPMATICSWPERQHCFFGLHNAPPPQPEQCLYTAQDPMHPHWLFFCWTCWYKNLTHPLITDSRELSLIPVAFELLTMQVSSARLMYVLQNVGSFMHLLLNIFSAQFFTCYLLLLSALPFLNFKFHFCFLFHTSFLDCNNYFTVVYYLHQI